MGVKYILKVGKRKTPMQELLDKLQKKEDK